MQIERLFDILEQYQRLFPEKSMLNGKEKGIWRSYRASEVQNTSLQLARSLRSLNSNHTSFEPEVQQKIAIISNNRPEWIIVDFATQMIGAVLVPIYPSMTESEWLYILQESKAQCSFYLRQNYL